MRIFLYRCRHCKEFHPIWSELGNLINSRKYDIAIAQVDCMKHSKLCKENDITGIIYEIGPMQTVHLILPFVNIIAYFSRISYIIVLPQEFIYTRRIQKHKRPTFSHSFRKCSVH